MTARVLLGTPARRSHAYIAAYVPRDGVMTTANAEALNREPRKASRIQDLVRWGTWAGLLAALVGFIDGIVMTARRKVTSCADGTYFPEGTTDFNCYHHPQAAMGIGLVAMSLMLGILIVLAGIAARASLRG